jgi:hypothetical protein
VTAAGLGNGLQDFVGADRVLADQVGLGRAGEHVRNVGLDPIK